MNAEYVVPFSCNNPHKLVTRYSVTKGMVTNIRRVTLDGVDGWIDDARAMVSTKEPPKNAVWGVADAIEADKLSDKKSPLDAEPAVYFASDYAYHSEPTVIVATADGSAWETVDVHYLGYFLRTFKGCTFKLSRIPMGAITVMHEGRRVGIVMPMNLNGASGRGADCARVLAEYGIGADARRAA
jgi:hypothetical protein